jgi:signal transduction histidine kinase
VNLVSNAVKFTDSGSVTVQTRADGAEVRVSVVDTGRGMRRDEIEEAFKEFRQLKGTGGAGGSGLGLTICKRFVEMHGGRIWANSTYGIGSTFNFSVPATS